MNPAPAGSLLAYLAQVPDPRGRQGRRHSLSAMLATVVCALFSGAKSLSAIVQWLHCQPPEVWHALGYFRRPPKDHAFRDLLAAIPPDQLEQLIATWTEESGLAAPLDGASQTLDAIALDGKSLCGTLHAHRATVHLLAAFQQRTGVALRQCEVDAKTNEHKAALTLVRHLTLTGRVVTGDAMFCQREVCREIRDRGGHYFFAVKDNQPSLREAIAAEFQPAFSPLL